MKFKIGDKVLVKTEYRNGEILYIDDDDYAPYLVGIKGYNGHNAEYIFTEEEIQKYVIDKGYKGQCYWYDEDELELIKEEKKMKFKVGDKVKTSYGDGEVVFIDDDSVPYLVGIKGCEGHSAEGHLSLGETQKYIIDKGYEGQCHWLKENSLELIEEKSESTDKVNHPSHYNQGKYETIKEMEMLFGKEETRIFAKLNAFKYMRRANFKGNEEEDKKKAEWYLDYLAETEEK